MTTAKSQKSGEKKKKNSGSRLTNGGGNGWRLFVFLHFKLVQVFQSNFKIVTFVRILVLSVRVAMIVGITKQKGNRLGFSGNVWVNMDNPSSFP